MKLETLKTIDQVLWEAHTKRSEAYFKAIDEQRNVERSFLNIYGERWEAKLTKTEEEELAAVKSDANLAEFAFRKTKSAIDDFESHEFL